MTKLLMANYYRLKKNKIFWLIIIFSLVLASFYIATKYEIINYLQVHAEAMNLIFNYSKYIGIIVAIFTSLFIGIEYSDLIIRNKISKGHKRRNIYLSNLITSVLVSFIAYILYIIIIISLGYPLIGKYIFIMPHFYLALTCVFLQILVYASLFTFVAMLISNKNIMTVTSMTIILLLMIFSKICYDVLKEPQTIMSSSNTEINNPNYKSANEKNTYRFLLEINPVGQSMELLEGEGEIFYHDVKNSSIENKDTYIRLMLYSSVIIILFTISGTILFEKKEIN